LYHLEEEGKEEVRRRVKGRIILSSVRSYHLKGRISYNETQKIARQVMQHDGSSRMSQSPARSSLAGEFRSLPTTPLSPDSEHRYRKNTKTVVLMQQQQQRQNKTSPLHHPNSGSMHSSGSSNNLGHLEMMPLMNESSSASLGQSSSNRRSSGSTTSAALARTDNHSRRFSRDAVVANCRRLGRSSSAASRRTKRFISAIGFIAAFCILIVFREKQQDALFAPQELADEQSVDKTELEKHHHSSSSIASTSSNNNNRPSSQTTATTDSSRERIYSQNPMQPLTGNSPLTIPPTSSAHTESDGDGDDDDDDENVENGDGDTADTDKDENEPARQDHSTPSKPSSSKAQSSEQQPTTETKPNPKPPKIAKKASATNKFYPQAPYDPSMELQYPMLPADTTNNHSYVRRYCDLQGSDWFPIINNQKEAPQKQQPEEPLQPQTSSSNSWHQRAPFFVILGPSHGGSETLGQLLATHPQVADAMQSNFFTYNAKRYSIITKPSTSAAAAMSNKKQKPGDTDNNSTAFSKSTTSVRVKTRAARRAYMARHVSDQKLLQNHLTQVVVDNNPDTLLYSHLMAPVTMCVMPWVKLVIVVNHPIRRLLRHYHVAQGYGLTLGMDDWIARDLERLQQAGILQPPTQQQQDEAASAAHAENNNNNLTTSSSISKSSHPDRSTTPNSQSHHNAWIRYQELTHTAMEASAGQSMYEFMMHPWFDHMQRMGRNPATEIVVVQEEVLLLSPSKSSTTKDSKSPEDQLLSEYHRVLQQLGLVEHTPPALLMHDIVAEHQREMSSWRQKVDKTVRRQLQHFFAPYNTLLDQFLKSYYTSATDTSSSENKIDPNLLRWKPELWKN